MEACRSLAWEDLRPNLPWLVQALLTVALDLVIMWQYRHYKVEEEEEEEQ